MSISRMQRIKKMLLLTSHPMLGVQLILFYMRIYLGLIIILCTSNRLFIPFSNLVFPASDLGFPGGTSGKESTCQCGRQQRHSWVRSLGWEDPLEEGTVTHCSILDCRIPWIEAPGGLQSTGWQRVRHDWSNLACKWFGMDGKSVGCLKNSEKCAAES